MRPTQHGLFHRIELEAACWPETAAYLEECLRGFYAAYVALHAEPEAPRMPEVWELQLWAATEGEEVVEPASLALEAAVAIEALLAAEFAARWAVVLGHLQAEDMGYFFCRTTTTYEWLFWGWSFACRAALLACVLALL